MKGSNACRDRVKGCAVVVNIARQPHPTSGHNMPKDSEHTNTSVFQFYVSKPIKSSVIGIVQKPEWIKESKWRLRTDLVLETGIL